VIHDRPLLISFFARLLRLDPIWLADELATRFHNAASVYGTHVSRAKRAPMFARCWAYSEHA
jgi:hypothetical protein